jgi:hypothetical protein
MSHGVGRQEVALQTSNKVPHMLCKHGDLVMVHARGIKSLRQTSHEQEVLATAGLMDVKCREGAQVVMQVRIMGYRGEDKWSRQMCGCVGSNREVDT